MLLIKGFAFAAFSDRALGVSTNIFKVCCSLLFCNFGYTLKGSGKIAMMISASRVFH